MVVIAAYGPPSGHENETFHALLANIKGRGRRRRSFAVEGPSPLWPM